MHGLPTFEKKVRQIKRNSRKTAPPPPRAQMHVGSWRFEEDSDGNLVVKHLETAQIIIIARPE